jgi:hypothetical protein
MKLTKTASGKKSLIISKSEWLRIGSDQGWLEKKAENAPHLHHLWNRWKDQKITDEQFLGRLESLKSSADFGVSSNYADMVALLLQRWRNGEDTAEIAEKINVQLGLGNKSGVPESAFSKMSPEDQAAVDAVETGRPPQAV